MVQYQKFWINKSQVTLLEITDDGRYLVYLSCGKIISVDEATFNSLK